MELNRIYNMDCMEGMKLLPSGSIDMILCDLPYGTTHNKWDSVIPLDALWAEYERVIKNNGAIVLTGQSAFTARLITSNDKNYRYSLVWEKTRAGGYLNAKRMPLQAHEDIAVFYKSAPTYNPQMIFGGKPYKKNQKNSGTSTNYGSYYRAGTIAMNDGARFPRSVIKIENGNYKSMHPTQKPVALFEYLIRTYTNEDETVLDNCAGSGTTAIACMNTGRNFICMEKDENYHRIACERFAAHSVASPLT